jgi:uncharacterized membrane protein YsdA (DUF1294 family)
MDVAQSWGALAGLFWIVFANVMAFALFGIDKRLAVAGAWRISESTLLLFALAGGSIGAVAGQRYFRHKTRKEPFRSTLYFIIGLQVAAVALLATNPHLLADLFRYLAATADS